MDHFAGLDVSVKETSLLESNAGSRQISAVRTLAWEAANEKARHLGWVKSCHELHEQ
jgi:hypothetical protein